MKFKNDENLPAEVADLLQKTGYDAVSVLDQDLGGSTDDCIYQICKQEKRVIVTLDIDFANIIAYPPKESLGIIIMRLTQQDKKSILSAMNRVIELLEQHEINQKLWIVSDEKLRIRE